MGINRERDAWVRAVQLRAAAQFRREARAIARGEEPRVEPWVRLLFAVWAGPGMEVYRRTRAGLEGKQAEGPLRRAAQVAAVHAAALVAETQARLAELAATFLGEALRREQRALYRTWAGGRALTIARTEVLTATSTAQHLAARATGQELLKDWVSVGDERVRPSHKAFSAMRPIPLDQPWVSPSGALVMHSHDPDAPASETLGCRCINRHVRAPR